MTTHTHGHERSLHVVVIPEHRRSPISLVHLTGSEVDDLATLRWLHHPEKGWALGYDPDRIVMINVRATMLAREAGEQGFICGAAVLTGSGPDDLVDVAHELITYLSTDWRYN